MWGSFPRPFSRWRMGWYGFVWEVAAAWLLRWFSGGLVPPIERSQSMICKICPLVLFTDFCFPLPLSKKNESIRPEAISIWDSLASACPRSLRRKMTLLPPRIHQRYYKCILREPLSAYGWTFTNKLIRFISLRDQTKLDKSKREKNKNHHNPTTQPTPRQKQSTRWCPSLVIRQLLLHGHGPGSSRHSTVVCQHLRHMSWHNTYQAKHTTHDMGRKGKEKGNTSTAALTAA